MGILEILGIAIIIGIFLAVLIFTVLICIFIGLNIEYPGTAFIIVGILVILGTISYYIIF